MFYLLVKEINVLFSWHPLKCCVKVRTIYKNSFGGEVHVMNITLTKSQNVISDYIWFIFIFRAFQNK